MTVPGTWQLEDKKMTQDDEGLATFVEDYRSPERKGIVNLRFAESTSDPVNARELKMLYKFGGGDGFEIVSAEVVTINGRAWNYGITKKTGGDMPIYLHEFQTDTKRGLFQISFFLKTTTPSRANDMIKAMQQTMQIRIQ